MKRRRSVTRMFIVTACFVMGVTTLISCGGGGGGSSATPAVPPAFDVAGTWTITETGTSNSCEEPIDPPYTATITQNGSSVGVQFPSQPERVYNGTMSGDAFTGSGSYPDTGGTTTEIVAVTVWSDTSLSGRSTWSWTDGIQRCGGTTDFAGSRSGSTQTSPPSAPTGLSATATSSMTIALTWTDTSNNETAFMVYRGTSTGAVTTLIGTVVAGVTSYTNTDNTLSPSTTYHYGVTAINAAGESGLSNIASATTLPPPATAPIPPAGLSATATSSTSVALTWTDTSNNETGFRVYRGTSTGAVTTLIATVAAGVTSYTDNTLSPSTTYYYGVTAINAAGESASATDSATTPGGLVGPSLTGPSTATTGLPFGLTWTYTWPPPGPAGATACTGDGYKLDESSTSSTGGFVEIYSSALQSNFEHTSPKTYIISKASPGTYYYRVRAFNCGSFTPYSNVVAVTVASPTNAILSIVNNTQYDVVDLHLNGTQMLTYPEVILPGASRDFTFNSSGSVSIAGGVGFYNPDTTRDPWFTYTGSATVTVGRTTANKFNNPTIGQLLTHFSTAQNWDGAYYDYSSFTLAHTARFRFTSSGGWTFYVDGIQKDSGTVTLVSWPIYTSLVTFKICPTCTNIELSYPFASFSFNNGPPGWTNINYVAQ